MTPSDADTGRGRRRQAGPFFAVGDLKRAFDRFRDDDMTDHAAALTYYALMSLFPALLLAIALLGLLGQQSLITDAAGYLRDAGADRTTVDAVTRSLEAAIENRGTAATALVLGTLTALYGASGAFGAAGRALNVVFRVDEGRPFVRRKLTDMGSTLVVILLALIAMVLVLLGGGVAADVLGLIGLGETAAGIWPVVRWPAALAVTTLLYAWVYWAAPNVEVRRFQVITPGAATGVLLWILASAGFFFYVSNFSSYSATYGAFAAAVILLVWLWLTNVALLFGAEVNAASDVRRSPDLPRGYDGPPLPEKVPAEA